MTVASSFLQECKTISRHLPWVFLCTLLSHGAQAEEEDYFGDLPIVASASRFPQKLSAAPAAVSVIDREMIKAMGARDISELLRIVPGFQTFVRNTASPSVTYHGITDEGQSSRIQVLIDGRSQFSALFDGGINWSLLPVALEDIERIEVVRGSNAASYGGNSFQALVNIITVDPALTHGTSLTASHGNQGVRDYTLRQGGKLGDAGDYRFTYQSKTDTGLQDHADWKDRYGSEIFDWRADLAINNQDSLQINAGHMHSRMLDGRLGQADNPIHNLDWSTSYLQASWRRIQSADAEIQLRYSLTDDQTSSRYNGVYGVPFTYDPNGSEAKRHEIEVVQHNKLGADIRTVWGASYRHESVVSQLFFPDAKSHDRSSSRLFGNLEWQASSLLTANLGLGLEHDSIVGQIPSSRASLNFHVTPENTVRLAAFSSERTMSITGYSGGLNVQVGATNVRMQRGNSDLGTERVKGLELGFVGEWKNIGMTLDVRAFAERIPNRWAMIAREYQDCIAHTVFCFYGTSNGAQRALNTELPVQDVHTRGIEYQLSWTPWRETRVVLSQAFTKINAEYLASMLADPANVILAPLPGNQKYANFDAMIEQSTPSHATSLLFMQKLPYGFDFSAFGQWVGAMKWTTNTAVRPYQRIDIRLGYPFRAGKLGGEIALTAQSIDGPHGEFDMRALPTDRIIDHRNWVTLRLDF